MVDLGADVVVDPPEEFDVELPDSWLNPSANVRVNHDEANIPQRLSVEHLTLILEGMRNYPYDPRNTLLPLFAFKAGILPPSLFNFVYRLCRKRKSEANHAAVKRVMYLINMAYESVSYMESNGHDWRNPKPKAWFLILLNDF